MKMRRRSCFMATASIVMVLLAEMGCLGGDPGTPIPLAYYVATVESDPRGSSEEICQPANGMKVSYVTPSGAPVSVRADREPIAVVRLDRSVRVQLIDYRRARSPEMKVVVADVMTSPMEHSRVEAARRARPRCDLLIMLDGQPVGIERRGTDWQEHLPGGVFATPDAAERAFARSEAILTHGTPPTSELEAQDAFWEWRRRRDIWEFHCDPAARRIIQERVPDVFEALQSTPAPDCQSPPAPPEEN